MIDVEAKIYTSVATALREAFSGIEVSGEYVKAPSRFPFVSMEEADNYPTTVHMDNGDAEKYVTLMYEINVYSNRGVGKKSECRAIMQLIDSLMYGMNFTRLALTSVPNLDDATIYRMTARYRAETDGTNLYRR